MNLDLPQEQLIENNSTDESDNIPEENNEPIYFDLIVDDKDSENEDN